MVVYPAPRMPVTNGGVGLGFPTKHGIILVVTVTGWGVDPMYMLYPLSQN